MMDLNDTLPYINISFFDIIMAIAILIIGFIVAKFILYVFKKSVSKTNLPPLMVTFLGRLFSIVLYIAVILLSASYLGLEVGSLVIGLSAIIGIVLGFGMKDTFNNLAAGAWLATIRPFRKGEHVKIQGLEGIINAVGMMSTELIKPDNTFITIPNSVAWGSPIINYTRKKNRRVDVNVGIGYNDDINEAINLAIELMNNHNLVLTDPKPAVTVNELGDSSVNLTIKAWTSNEDYWTAKHELTKEILNVYNNKGIEMPYTQIEVHMDKEG